MSHLGFLTFSPAPSCLCFPSLFFCCLFLACISAWSGQPARRPNKKNTSGRRAATYLCIASDSLVCILEGTPTRLELLSHLIQFHTDLQKFSLGSDWSIGVGIASGFFVFYFFFFFFHFAPCRVRMSSLIKFAPLQRRWGNLIGWKI